MPELGGPGLTLFEPGRQIIPTYYYWPPQCFSPSGITVVYRSGIAAPEFVQENILARGKEALGLLLIVVVGQMPLESVIRIYKITL